MTPEQLAAIDGQRAALALIAAAAEHADDGDLAAILGPGWQADRGALIAWQLARWFVDALHRLGHDDPAAARDVIADSIAAEARKAGQ